MLAAINLLLFLSHESHIFAVRADGFIPLLFSATPFVSSYQFATATVLHGDIFHLADSCLFPLVFGRSLVMLFGAPAMLAGFHASRVAGFLLEGAVHAVSPLSVIGASGAIAAMMGAYMPLFPGSGISIVLFRDGFGNATLSPPGSSCRIGSDCSRRRWLADRRTASPTTVHVCSFAAGTMAAIICKTSYLGAEEKLVAFKRESFT